MGRHSASLRDAINLSKQNIRYIVVEAVQDVLEAAQTPQPGVERTGGTFIEGKIPVVSSNLIDSLRSSLNGVPSGESETSYIAVLAGYDLGDEMEFAWTAPYALRIEKGFVGTDRLGRTFNVPGRRFVGKNVESFSQFVERRAREVRS